MLLYYIAAFLAAVAVSLVLTRWIRDTAVRRGWLDNPKAGRHFHARPVPRIGGVSIFLSFLLVTAVAVCVFGLRIFDSALSSRSALGILLPAALIFVLGLYDDRVPLGPYVKFGVQTVAAVWLYLSGFGIHLLVAYSPRHPLGIAVALPLTIIWVLLITNAFNLIDGLDGLSAGSALFSTIIIFAVSMIRHTPEISLLSAVLAGAILGFLRYNFHPASIFLGDSGSLFIGFLLSALALTGSQKSTTVVAVAIPVLAFGLPLLDVCLSILRRFMNNKPLFLGDDEHVHHKLLKRGLSHRDAVLVLYAVAGAFGLLSLTLLHRDIKIGFVLLLIGAGVSLGVQQLRYVEFYELAATVRLIWRRKRVTANNLQVRRAIETFPVSVPEFPDICRILQESLDSAGFCGISILFSHAGCMHEPSFFPLRRNGTNRYSHFWTEIDCAAPEWELKLELTSSSGSKFADLFLFRQRASDPVLVDVSLMSNEFRTAVSNAVYRAIGGVLVADRTQGRIEDVLEVTAAGGAA